MVFGEIDTADILTHTRLPQTLKLWYHLLNCGFRLPATAGTDRIGPEEPVGHQRVYVKLDGPLTYPGWMEGLRQGRSFVTNGPMVSLSVDGHGPGETLTLSKRKVLRIEARARSLRPFERLEIVVNGKVAAGVPSQDQGRRAELGLDYPADRSLWIAARCMGGSPEETSIWTHPLFAHANPVYVDYAGRALAEPESGCYWLDFLKPLEQWAREEALVRESGTKGPGSGHHPPGHGLLPPPVQRGKQELTGRSPSSLVLPGRNHSRNPMTPSAKPGLIPLLCLTLAACAPTPDDRTPSGSNGAENWKRDQRSFVYLSERRARYAGITRTTEGPAPDPVHSPDGPTGEGRFGRTPTWSAGTRDGDWWFYPETVFEGREGEPRAMGTLATLESGRIIAPFAELKDGGAGSRLRLLASEDHGETWTATEPLGTHPLVWAAPYGKSFEAGGRVLMPVHGAVNPVDLAATRLQSGLLQSTDGGKSWGDWIPIAAAGPEADLSYEFPAVLPLQDGTWLAVLTERQLKKRPGLPLDIPQTLVRSYSTDRGKSWTRPEPLSVGSWASLTPMGNGTVACSFALWSAWGSMEVMFSDDGFRTIRHRVPFVEHNWLPGYGPSGWGGGWARDPIPLPPVVPNLEGDWKAGHYGFSSGLALDEDRLMLVLGQRQKGSGYTDPPHEVNLPIEKERIETIVMKRVREPSAPAAELPGAHGEPDGQWYLAERWPEEEWRRKVGQPPNDVTLVLESGRWIRLSAQYTVPHQHGPGRIMGRERGYWVWKSVDGLHYRTLLQGSYSDDRGKDLEAGQG